MSDHFSGVAGLDDPAVDITDVFAFPSPERRRNPVVIMNVCFLATSQSLLRDVVTHRFRLRAITRARAGVAAAGARTPQGSHCGTSLRARTERIT